MTAGGRHRAALAAVLLGGALLRALYLAELRHSPDFDRPGLDALYHDYWARAVVIGDWTPPAGYDDPLIRTTPYFRPPGYPWFLAGVYRIAGRAYIAPRIAQMALGLLSAVAAYAFARRWFGDLAGLLAAAGMSLYWPFLYYEGELLEPALVVFVGLALIGALSLWADRMTWARAAVAGISLGAYALARPNVLLFAVTVPFWAVWMSRRTGQPARAAARASAIFLVGAIAAVAPATIRNALVSGDVVLVSSNGGINLLLGQSSVGAVSHSSDVTGNWTCFDYPGIVRKAEAAAGRRLSQAEASRHFARQALTEMRAAPARALRGLGAKALLFWGPLEVSNNKEEEIERLHSRVLSLLPIRFPLALALGAVGVLLAFARRAGAEQDRAPAREVVVLILLFVVVYFASFLPFVVAGQYRTPIVPFLLILGSSGVADLVLRPRRPAAVAALAGCAVYAAASVNFTGYRPSVSDWHYDRAVALERGGRTNEAAVAYAEALREQPGNVQALYNLGLVSARAGRSGDARAAFERALAIDPGYFKARVNLGSLLVQQGDFAAALEHLARAEQQNPDSFEVRYNLGLALALAGRIEEAIPHFEAAARRAPSDFDARYHLGLALARSGRFNEAAAAFRVALAIRPGDPQAMNDLQYCLGHGAAAAPPEPAAP